MRVPERRPVALALILGASIASYVACGGDDSVTSTTPDLARERRFACEFWNAMLVIRRPEIDRLSPTRMRSRSRSAIFASTGLRRRRRDRSLEGLGAAEAHANARKREVTILTSQLLAALLSCRERTRIFVTRNLLLASALPIVSGSSGIHLNIQKCDHCGRVQRAAAIGQSPIGELPRAQSLIPSQDQMSFHHGSPWTGMGVGLWFFESSPDSPTG